MRNSTEDVVKSVARVFQILEFFDGKRRPLTATEIGKGLRYPASSTIGLLKSMTTLGYLSFNCIDFTYSPTMRLPMVGQWIKDTNIAGDLAAVMLQIHRATGESVSVCSESDGHMQVLAIAATADIATFSQVSAVGDRTPLFRSVVGLTALSTRSDTDVMHVANQLLRRPRYLRPDIDINSSMTTIRRFRATGFGVAYGLSLPHVGAIAWAVTTRNGTPPLVLGLWGPTLRIKENESILITKIKNALGAQPSRHF